MIPEDMSFIVDPSREVRVQFDPFADDEKCPEDSGGSKPFEDCGSVEWMWPVIEGQQHALVRGQTGPGDRLCLLSFSASCGEVSFRRAL